MWIVHLNINESEKSVKSREHDGKTYPTYGVTRLHHSHDFQWIVLRCAQRKFGPLHYGLQRETRLDIRDH